MGISLSSVMYGFNVAQFPFCLLSAKTDATDCSLAWTTETHREANLKLHQAAVAMHALCAHMSMCSVAEGFGHAMSMCSVAIRMFVQAIS